MKKIKNVEIRSVFVLLCILFLTFLVVPIIILFIQSLVGNEGFTFTYFQTILQQKQIRTVFLNSIGIALLGACITTVLAFIMAYTIHFTNVRPILKKGISTLALLPMLLPTITYGFAIIYSFGKQGLLTRLFGWQLFDIYGINGLLIGYVIYTLPVAFMLLHNSMSYIDKKFSIVSRLMGDNGTKTFFQTVFQPLLGTFAISIIQCFFLSFTDFGIPASVGGKVDVIAGVLYNEMLGSVPNFHRGAVVAFLMLLPSIVSICVLTYLERYNIRYQKVSQVELKKNTFRDIVFGCISYAILLLVLSIFAVVIIVPFVEEWPYRMHFTVKHVSDVFSDVALVTVVKNSLLAAILTAITGTLVSYGAALITARSTMNKFAKKVLDSIAQVTNTIPGMVLGIAFLLTFTGTSLQNTMAILVLCNIIHFFSTPYLMLKGALEKMNASWETTARLMGDSWIKTILRIVTPNAFSTLLEVFGYYFVNAMVTVSAIIFLAGARTMVITTKIKELQHYAKFNEIFVLSLLILCINITAKALIKLLAAIKYKEKRSLKMKRKTWKKAAAMLVAGVIACTGIVTGCGKQNKQVVIYSNADDEAVDAMKKALDENGYSGKYILQTFGTSELGGKLLAEGKNIEADLVTMSSFYLDSAQDEKQMFCDLTFDTQSLDTYPDYYTPITSQEGAIILNTEVMKENNLPTPTSLKDLANKEYAGFISVPDISGSSTAWLMLQALINQYGETEAKTILKAIYDNAGAHLEESGSGPLKKVRAGEVAIGFGLRHQAVADKADGLPIDFVDPTEGNFSLTESVAVVDKKGENKDLAMKMAECIIKEGRKELIKTYPNPIYKCEKADKANQSTYPKTFPEKLTVDLLEKHKNLSEACK